MAAIAQKCTSAKASPASRRTSVAPCVRAPVNACRGSPLRTAPISSRRQVALHAAAEAGLDTVVRTGKVGNVLPKDIGTLQKEGWTVLDVRPPGEVAKVAIQDAVHVPIYVEDPDRDLSALVKQSLNFGMGGWWLGGWHMIPNPNFLGEVQAKVPKDTKLIVGCQKGLRSLAACESLMRAGYQTVSWVNGGFDACRKGDLPTLPDNKDIRYAGIGGVAELLGWTDVQRDEKKERLGGQSGVITFFIFLLAADALLFVYEYADAYFKTGKLPWE